VVPAGHWHAPATHVAPPVHATPHAPQFEGLLVKLTHAPPQAILPSGQDAAHAPRAHTSLAAQA
jgi:hypothetical protein